MKSLESQATVNKTKRGGKENGKYCLMKLDEVQSGAQRGALAPHKENHHTTQPSVMAMCQESYPFATWAFFLVVGVLTDTYYTLRSGKIRWTLLPKFDFWSKVFLSELQQQGDKCHLLPRKFPVKILKYFQPSFPREACFLLCESVDHLLTRHISIPLWKRPSGLHPLAISGEEQGTLPTTRAEVRMGKDNAVSFIGGSKLDASIKMEEEELRTEPPMVHIFTRVLQGWGTAEVPKIIKTHEHRLLDCPSLRTSWRTLTYRATGHRQTHETISNFILKFKS